MVLTSEALPEANRSGSLEQPWAGDDQQWWDWYVTLAANPTIPEVLVEGPGLPEVAPATAVDLDSFLEIPYPLTQQQREQFRAEAFVKLPGVLSAPIVRLLADRVDTLLRAAHGDDTVGRFTALEQMWLDDDLLRAVVLSPRIGDLAAELVGADVRVYHDNVLSKEPGCGRTPWHHDAEHFPLATLSAVTAWMPLSAIPRAMGPLTFARHHDARPLLEGVAFERVGTTYDTAVAERFRAAGVLVEAAPFDVGEVSFHGALCFHTAGPNHTHQPRRALATTYYEDGARVVDRPTMVSGAWRDFLPGIEPGDLAATSLNPIVGRFAGDQE